MEAQTLNSDYPHALGNGTAEDEARDPVPFPDPEYDRCIRVVAMVEDGNFQTVWTRAGSDGSNEDLEDDSSSSSSSSDSDSDMDYDSDSDMSEDSVDDDDKNFLVILEGGQEAFWLRRILRGAIYGNVWFASVVTRKSKKTDASDTQTSDMVTWEVTGERCAVKEMPWKKINGLCTSEDPIKEVAALQYLRRWHDDNNTANNTTIMQDSLNNHVVMPRNVLNDGEYLYIMTPFLEGGEIFDRLFDENTGERFRFTENEARYWMDHILDGIETLQRAGICHRDLSIENLMIHENRCLVIDMGMCLRIPYTEERHRFLIRPQPPCGKWRNMSPEICRSVPFDGYAVDMWAVGTILFTMLVGFIYLDNQRERAFVLRLFNAFSRGRVDDTLRRDLANMYGNFSPELVDLLQKMFWFDAERRLSLDQVRSHSWMNGPRQVPR